MNNLSPILLDSVSQSTLKELNQEKKLWIRKCSNWLKRAKSFYKATNAYYKLSLSSKDVLKSIKKIKNFQQKQDSYLKLLSEGYKILNEVGEWVRGEEILYNITLTSSGKNISKVGVNTEVITFKMKIDDFLKTLRASSTRLVLKSNKLLFDSLINKYNINRYVWKSTEIEEFQTFLPQGRRVREGEFYPWVLVNEGNVLEAFMLFKSYYSNTKIEYNEAKEYWEKIHRSMIDTLRGKSLPFFRGGDILNQQIKGLNASVTNINTLIINISELQQILSGQSINSSSLETQLNNINLADYQNKIIYNELQNMFSNFKLNNQSLKIELPQFLN